MTSVLSADERDVTLARAQVWRRPHVPVSEAYLGQDRSAPREFDCTFKLNPPSGTTPTIDCVTADGEEIRIKHGVGGEAAGRGRHHSLADRKLDRGERVRQ